MKIFTLTLILIGTIVSSVFAQSTQKEINTKINSLEKPLYTPFVENYILHELKTLRDENRELKVMLNEKISQNRVDFTDRVMQYSTSTVANMFYILAAASSILVLLGWNSLRELNDRLKTAMDDKISDFIKANEERMKSLEVDIEKRSKLVLKNQEEITKTNTIQSLWMRAGLEATPSGKMEIYNQILHIRPHDAEVICYKADAALEMDEANWALSLANQALEIDEDYFNAYFQRARAYVKLGLNDNAIEDIEKTLQSNDQYFEEINKEEDFEPIKNDERYIEIISQYNTNENKYI